MHLNPKSKGRWKWLLVIVVPVVALGVIGKMTNTNPPTNMAKTTPDETPALRTRIYKNSLSDVFIKAQFVVAQQKTWGIGWRIASLGPLTAGEFQRVIKVEVPVVFFTDDLEIKFSSEGDFQEGERTVVNVTSKSRVGQGDFGENRRHVAQFLRALDKEIGNSGI